MSTASILISTVIINKYTNKYNNIVIIHLFVDKKKTFSFSETFVRYIQLCIKKYSFV